MQIFFIVVMVVMLMLRKRLLIPMNQSTYTENNYPSGIQHPKIRDILTN
jgi:hypothetical protein